MLGGIGLSLTLTGFGLLLLTSMIRLQTFSRFGLYKLWLGGRYVGFGVLLPGLVISAVDNFLNGYWTSGVACLLIGPAFLVFWIMIHQADQKRTEAKN